MDLRSGTVKVTRLAISQALIAGSLRDGPLFGTRCAVDTLWQTAHTNFSDLGFGRVVTGVRSELADNELLQEIRRGG